MRKKDAPMQNDEAAVSGEKQEDTAGEKQEDTTDSEQDQYSDDGEVSESELPKILTAVYPILYLTHQYKVGDALPTNDPEMVEAWIAAGTADWLSVKEPVAKAKPQTAEQGLFGGASTLESENGENLVGKMPKTDKRKRQA